MFSKFFPQKKCTDLRMNTQKNFTSLPFFLSGLLPMGEGRSEDIGNTCLLFTVDKLT